MTTPSLKRKTNYFLGYLFSSVIIITELIFIATGLVNTILESPMHSLCSKSYKNGILIKLQRTGRPKKKLQKMTVSHKWPKKSNITPLDFRFFLTIATYLHILDDIKKSQCDGHGKCVKNVFL